MSSPTMVEWRTQAIRCEHYAEIYSAAIDLIEKYGWIQGRYGEHGLGFCITGAIREQFPVAGTDVRFIDMCDFLHYRIIGDIAPAWNDREERTKEDIICVLQQAMITQRIYAWRCRKYEVTLLNERIDSTKD